MKLSINIKGLSRKKVIHQEEIEIVNEISTTKDLIKELVTINVEKFNKKIDDKDILSIMTNEYIAEAARSGKIGDEVHGDKKANLEKALDTAYLAFEDGLYCIFVNDEQTEKLEDNLALKDGDEFIVVTERGIQHKIYEKAPNKKLYFAAIALMYCLVTIKAPTMTVFTEPFAELITNYFFNVTTMSTLKGLFISDAGYFVLYPRLIALIVVKGLRMSPRISVILMQNF